MSEAKMSPSVLAQTTGRSFAITWDKEDCGRYGFGKEDQEGLLVHWNLKWLLGICGSQPSRWPPVVLTSWIYSFVGFPLTLDVGLSIWPVEYCKCDGIWLLRLNHKTHEASPLIDPKAMSTFLLSVIILAGGSLISRMSCWSRRLFNTPHKPILGCDICFLPGFWLI